MILIIFVEYYWILFTVYGKKENILFYKKQHNNLIHNKNTKELSANMFIITIEVNNIIGRKGWDYSFQ